MIQRENKDFKRVPQPTFPNSTYRPKFLSLGGGFGKGIPESTMRKIADSAGVDFGNFGGDSNMSNFQPELRNPTLNSDMFFLPKYYSPDGFPNIELNIWCDHYLRFHPLVHNLIDLHATLPISRFGLVKIKDDAILNNFEEMMEDMQAEQMNHYFLKGYFARGEAQPLTWWDDSRNRWSGMTLVDTNYITVTGHYLLHSKKGKDTEYYTLALDEYIQNLVHSNDPFEQNLVNECLQDDIRGAIQNNLHVRLDPFTTTLIKRKVNPWDLRGTSIMTNCLKTLLLEDKLRENDYATAQMNINPIHLWTYGNDLTPADDQMLLDVRDLVRNASYDPQFHIFSNHLLKLEIKGAAGALTELQPKWDYIENQILTTLWGNKAFTHSEGITYNNGTTAMRVLMGRYLPIRGMLENYYYQKVFLPVAFANDYFEKTTAERNNHINVKGGDRKPIYPTFDWRHKQALYDDSNVRSLLIQLQQVSKLPMKVICDSLDLDYQYVKTWLEKEMNTVFDNDYIAGKKQLMISAIAGTLQDTGENMVKRMISAGAAFVRLVTGNDENISIKEPKDDDKNKREPAKMNITDDEKKELKSILGPITEQEKYQETEKNRIIRQYADKVDKEVQERKLNNKFSKFEGVEGNQNQILRGFYNNYYPSSIITLIQKQLTEYKIAMSKEGQNYIAKRSMINENLPKYSINNSIKAVIDFEQENYEKKLFLAGRIAALEIAKKLGKTELPIEIKGVEKYSRINLISDDLEIVDRHVLSAYWGSLGPKIENKILDSFINFVKKCELETIEKCGIKECYLNNQKVTLAELKNKGFTINDRLIPDTQLKIKANYTHFGTTITNCPIELESQVYDTLKRFPLSGTLDLSTATWNEEKYNPIILDNYILAKFNKLDEKEGQPKLLDLHEKYFGGEKDEFEFFVKQSKKYLTDKIEESDLKEFLYNIY